MTDLDIIDKYLRKKSIVERVREVYARTIY